jgi:hypothetical protein
MQNLQQNEAIQNMNSRQCQEWVDSNGTINPTTGKQINPNLTSKTSKNVLISNRCLQLDITRPGNPYIPLQNVDTNQRLKYSPKQQKSTSNNSKNKQKDVKDLKYINKNISFKFTELYEWWNNGVMQKNEKIHFKHPMNKEKLEENSEVYNRLLQQSDVLCITPINIEYLLENKYISKVSFEILTDLRNEVKTKNINVQFLDKDNKCSRCQTQLRLLKYQKYLFRFNPKYRIPEYFVKDNIKEIDSIEKKSFSSASIENINDIDTTCIQNVAGIQNKYKKFQNKMIRVCENHKKQNTMMSKEEIQEMLRKYNSSSEMYDPKINIPIVSNYPLLSLFHQFYYNPKCLDMPKNNTRIVSYTFKNNRLIRDPGADVGGILNQTMSNIAHELFTFKVFIKQNEDSVKYCFNPEFRFEKKHIEYFKKIREKLSEGILKDITDGVIYNTFYKFIGKLLSFFLQNSFQIPHHLSSYILNCFKFKQNKIKDHEHIFYVMNDMPDMAKSIVNLMKEEPSTIEYLDMNYNDIYTIQFDKKEGDLITSQNLEQYFIDFAKHVNTNNILHIDQTSKTDKISDVAYIYHNFSQGIDNEFRKVLQYRNISHSVIDKMMTYEEITIEVLNKLYDNIHINIFMTNQAKDRMKYLENYRTYMKNILFNKNQKGQKLFTSDDFHTNFIKKLLQFWTGIDYYKAEIEYKINIIPYRTSGFPVSHTCFNKIDIPKYENENTFWIKLKEAVESSYNQFQIAGS